jgi:hypothetical protein
LGRRAAAGVKAVGEAVACSFSACGFAGTGALVSHQSCVRTDLSTVRHLRIGLSIDNWGCHVGIIPLRIRGSTNFHVAFRTFVGI